MDFEASLRLPCKRPDIVSAAICNEDAEVSRSSVSYSHETGCLLVRISAKEAKDLNKTLNSVLSRFKLSVETVDMCEGA